MGEIVRLALINNPFDLTGGPNGVSASPLPRWASWPSTPPSATTSWSGSWWACPSSRLRRLQRSRIGRAWNCIREDEVAAQATGINVRCYKLLAFVLGAALAGVAGNLYATKLIVVSPESFTLLGIVPDVQHRADRRHGLGARA